MPNKELEVLSAVCQHKDIRPVLEQSQVDRLFVAYPDVWQFIKSHYAKYKEIPPVTVLEERFEYFEAAPAPADPQYYVDRLREEFATSELSRITLKLRDKVGKAPSKVILNGVISDLMGLQGTVVAAQDRDITDYDAAMKEYDEVREKARENGGVPGIPTGIDFIDQAYTTGLSGGDLVVALGWTGRGKSLLTTKICANAFKQGYRPMIISLEMNVKKVQDRVYTMLGEGQFKNSDLSMGHVQEDDFRSWGQRVGRGKGFFVVSHDGNEEVTPALVQSKIDQHNPDIVVLDYAQLMSDNAGSSDMTARMRNMSKEFKRLAVANDIPIILISSATPESTSNLNSPPLLEQVAWSKQLSYDADLAFAVHMLKGLQLDGGDVVIEVAGRKNRNGDDFVGYYRANINSGIYEEFFDLEGVIGE